MFAQNSHLERMTADPTEVKANAWLLRTVFRGVEGHPFNSEAQARFLGYLTASPETTVRHAEVGLVPDVNHVLSSLILSASDVYTAARNGVDVTVDGLLVAGYQPEDVHLEYAHVAWLREMAIYPEHPINDPSHDISRLGDSLARRHLSAA